MLKTEPSYPGSLLFCLVTNPARFPPRRFEEFGSGFFDSSRPLTVDTAAVLYFLLCTIHGNSMLPSHAFNVSGTVDGFLIPLFCCACAYVMQAQLKNSNVVIFKQRMYVILSLINSDYLMSLLIPKTILGFALDLVI